MAIEVKAPKISEGVESAEITEVLVSEGDTIKEEQSIVVVESDKASVEIPSSDGGKIKEIKVKEGDELKVGDVILILEEEDGEDGSEGEKEDKEKEKEDKGEEEDEEEGEEEQEKEQKEKKPKKKEKDKEEDEEEDKDEEEEKEEKKKPAKEDKKEKEEDKEDKEKTEKSDGKGQIPASPAVRRFAREVGVDITKVDGSGPGGRITEDDIKAHSKGREKGKGAGENLSLPDFTQWGQVERQPLSGIRKATAKNTTASWQAIPHVFQFDEADITNIQEYMEKNNEKAEKEGGKLTITAILLKIVANGLQQFPKFNASVDMESEEMILKKYINIGIAVDTDKGLLVPVIRDVNKKSIIELSVELTEVAEKAREGKLSSEEMQGGNFSISNLGGIGGTNFTPIVYHPQAAILGVSRAVTKPVFINGEFQPRKVLPLSLSYDHRLIDGAEGAKFITWITQALEDPYKALLGA